MEIRDVIHGAIRVDPSEAPIVESRYFQRLRQIKQLGFGEISFPSATHTRFIHSLGAMHTASQIFDAIFNHHRGEGNLGQLSPQLPQEAFLRFRSILRLGALLHDVGHGPLSHTTEFAMPPVSQLRLPLPHLQNLKRKATHEDYTLKIILDSSMTPLLEKAGQPYGFKPIHIAALIDGQISVPDSFFMEDVETPEGRTSVDFRPLLSQIISSELDADRMDYLRRDSHYAGVSYGNFDFQWLLGHLSAHVAHQKSYLCLNHRAVYTFEDFLISRFHMFLMIYFHYKSVIYDAMLGQYLSQESCEYVLPADIEKYGSTNDTHLYSHLSQSKDPWAVRITQKQPYKLLIELHSGIPASKSAQSKQSQLWQQVKNSLKERAIHSLGVTSTGELSKYFKRPGHPIYVLYNNHYTDPSLILLEECSDLFQRYEEKRTISRLYVAPEDYRRAKHS